MLGSLRGSVAGRLDQRTLIEVNGVGYWVFTGSWFPEGETVCYLHHAVREDASDLFGFPDLDTLRLFEQLIAVNGIGPKAALAILSLGTADRVRSAIANEDAKFLSLASGIGPKAASKIVLELKNKVGTTLSMPDAPKTDYDDLLAAAQSLGYIPSQIQPLLAQLPSDLTTVQDQLTWLLRNLSR